MYDLDKVKLGCPLYTVSRGYYDVTGSAGLLSPYAKKRKK